MGAMGPAPGGGEEEKGKGRKGGAEGRAAGATPAARPRPAPFRLCTNAGPPPGPVSSVMPVLMAAAMVEAPVGVGWFT